MSPIRPRRSITRQLSELQAACRACKLCVDDGIIERAAPCFEGGAEAVFFLVGQAPGVTEVVHRRPFMGRAGHILSRWMARAGFTSDEEFRRFTYIAALIRCFPGRNPKGGGDRPPPVPAVRNCSRWLEEELELLRPPVVIPVGQLAIRRFLGPGPLEERVGKAFGDRPLFVPLPHPSGQSRWLNQPANRELLEAALARIGELRARLLPG